MVCTAVSVDFIFTSMMDLIFTNRMDLIFTNMMNLIFTSHKFSHGCFFHLDIIFTWTYWTQISHQYWILFSPPPLTGENLIGENLARVKISAFTVLGHSAFSACYYLAHFLLSALVR